MTHVKIDPRVFNDVYLQHLNNLARIQIFYGGAGSGKSVFMAQRAVVDLLKGGRNYLICRHVSKTVRRSVFNEVRKVMADWGVTHLFGVNKTEGIITCQNGFQILFTGLDDPEKIKSMTPEKGVITDIWVEEATETDRETVKDLIKRQRGGDPGTAKRLTLTFNPILQSHWIFEEYFKDIPWEDDQTEYTSPGLTILKTWYIHNRFLTPDDIEDLTNEDDPYYYQVYTLGNWGVLGDVIFTNWKVQDLSDIRWLVDEAGQRHDTFDNRKNGLDFGFSSHPAGLHVSHYDSTRKTIYIFEELYERGLTNDVLAGKVLEVIGRESVTCDSAEPKSIAELRLHGVNARGARKGRDSVLHGVQWLQQQTIIIDPSCIHHINEFRQYHWKKDKEGNAMPVPVDKNNHLIDACRYGYEDESQARKVQEVENPLVGW